MYLAPLNYDRFFKKVFSDPEIARKFLEDFLDTEIESIEILKDRHSVTDDAAFVEFDFRCKIQDAYVIIDMQQWYKADVTQRFYLYHALNTGLQTEDLPKKRIVLDKTSKQIVKVKDYRALEPVYTLIWMVNDSLKFDSNYVSYGMTPENLLDIEDVSGKRIISTRLRPNLTIREENTIPALEVMARFAANPKWLIYLPPTMSPCETSDKEEYLEYPEQAFDFYRRQGLSKVVCQEKHMGSRAVVIVCRDTETAKKHFGISDNEAGICYTRTGRRFFNDFHLENELLEKLRQAVEKAGIWDEFETGWVCLDCELMPWSAKAQALIKEQYAAGLLTLYIVCRTFFMRILYCRNSRLLTEFN